MFPHGRLRQAAGRGCNSQALFMTSKKRHIDKAVIVVALGMALTLAAYFYSLHHSGVQYEPEYRKVAAQVGPQFDTIARYLQRVERAYPDSSKIPEREIREAAQRKQGEFRFRMANMGEYGGKMEYCLVAENIYTGGRAYHSSVPVHDNTWQGKRSYYHVVTGTEPEPDLDGPCNEQVIRRR